MRFVCLVMILSISSLQAKVWSQQERLNLKLNDVNIVQFFDLLQKKTNLKFVFNHENVRQYRVNADVQNKTLTEILDQVFADKPLKYEITNEHVIILNAPVGQVQNKEMLKITGTVVDESGVALPGVTVLVKGTTIGAATDVEGRFNLQIPPTSTSTQLVFSFIGMKSK
ncbi:MAG: carboxypeptidase-like regulatory domain-containing protein [Odoribacter sp.]